MADMFAPLVAQLKANPKTIVFTEGNDPRILEAAAKLLAEGVLKVVMVGNEAECKAAADAGNFDISAAEIIDPENYAGFDEMVNTITLGFHNTAAAASIGKTATKDENGPQGLTAALTGGASAMCYTSEDVMAATFNVDLINEVGKCIGEDCLAMGYSGLYGPGINMHRTAYSGRNFEYYAEDPFVAGTICAAEVQGIQSKGVYVNLKHVALNDSETSRRGVNTWLNEQTAREIYLEVAV